MAERRWAEVHLSVTSLDNRLSAKLEPAGLHPTRLKTTRTLSEAGISVSVLVAPAIPMVTDHDLEHILKAAREAGANAAGLVLLRMPTS